MKQAISYLIEPFLAQYFLIDAICKDFITKSERKQIYDDLANVFCIPQNEETDAYFALANSDQYKNITDYAAYERLCRTIEFAKLSGQDVSLTPEDKVILAQKRESMFIKNELFKQCKNLTRDIISETLLTTAMNGSIDAMVTLSYMEYHGICVCKDEKNALKRLSLCAKWNNLFGNLMGVAYDKPNETSYYNTLYTILRSSNQREVFSYICEYTSYTKPCEKNAVSRIIENAFGLNIIKRNAYDRIFAKVAFSDLISIEDKEKLLLNKKKDAIVSLSVIPFDVERKDAFVFDEKKAEVALPERKNELRRMFCSISPAVNNRTRLYRTLLVAGDDDYISDMYADALKRGFSNNVIETDAAMLSMQDFGGAKENFILRGLSDTKKSHTVFVIKNCNEIGDDELSELIKLLDYEYRRKFKLLEPTVSLDLSDVLIILFASECNNKVARLAKECDTVRTLRINDTEKQTVIQSIFDDRSNSFGCTARLDDECKNYLLPFNTSQIILLIDSAIKKAMYEDEGAITVDTLRQISGEQNIHKNKREFGYSGGALNEKY